MIRGNISKNWTPSATEDDVKYLSMLDFDTMTASEFAAFKVNDVVDGGSYKMTGLVQGQISGNKCLKMGGIVSDENRIKFTKLFGGNFASADVGRKFVVYCNIYVNSSDSPGGAAMRVGMYGAKDTAYAYLPYYDITKDVPPNTWTQISLPVTVTSTMVTSGVVQFGISQRKTTTFAHTLYIDDVAVEEIGGGTGMIYGNDPIMFSMLLDDNNFSGAIENPIEYFADEIEIETNEEIVVEEEVNEDE